MVDHDGGGMARTLKDLFAGGVGGIAQVLVGQPFDIVKVRLQTSAEYKNAIDAASRIWKNEGPLAFYKGTLTPLLGIGACVSIQFGAFHEARRTFVQYNSKKHPERHDLTYGQYYIAGAAAGIANSVISGPIEHIRIRLQTQPHGVNRLYNGPLDCIKKIASSAGLFDGIYRGEAITIFREAQAYGLWFLTFEYLMNREAKNTERSAIPAWKVALYGGIAGEALWLGSYPLDVIKSKMQTDNLGSDRKYANTRDCIRKTWRTEGMRGFWKGIGPTLVRALPVSAATFAVVEATMKAIN